MTDCPRHSWRYLKNVLSSTDLMANGEPYWYVKLGEGDVFYCIHCLAYMTRSEILKQQEAE